MSYLSSRPDLDPRARRRPYHGSDVEPEPANAWDQAQKDASDEAWSVAEERYRQQRRHDAATRDEA